MKALQSKIILQLLVMVSLTAAFALHFTTDYALGGASPLALLLTAAGALLLLRKVELVGSLLLLFAGGALLLFPFLNIAPLVYALLALPILLLGLAQSIRWWQQDNN